MEKIMHTLAKQVVALLTQKHLTIGTVESATGGLIANLITDVPGSSDVYLGSVVSYSNEIKIRIVGVSEATLRENGAVSAPLAEEMATGGRKLLGVDICVADTGIAGPGGATPGKPVGLFHVGLAVTGSAYSRKHIFNGTREENKMSAALAALAWVKEWLEKGK
jgi:nicotinamide-nucleotide amidase